MPAWRPAGSELHHTNKRSPNQDPTCCGLQVRHTLLGVCLLFPTIYIRSLTHAPGAFIASLSIIIHFHSSSTAHRLSNPRLPHHSVTQALVLGSNCSSASYCYLPSPLCRRTCFRRNPFPFPLSHALIYFLTTSSSPILISNYSFPNQSKSEEQIRRFPFLTNSPSPASFLILSPTLFSISPSLIYQVFLTTPFNSLSTATDSPSVRTTCAFPQTTAKVQKTPHRLKHQAQPQPIQVHRQRMLVSSMDASKPLQHKVN